MHPADIQARLKKRGITQKEIAQELGVTEMAVSKVINKSSVSDRIMKAVARAIGEDYRAVFPEYYFGKGRHRKAA